MPYIAHVTRSTPKKRAKSNPIYHNRLVNMLVNHILKRGKNSHLYILSETSNTNTRCWSFGSKNPLNMLSKTHFLKFKILTRENQTGLPEQSNHGNEA